MEDDQNAKQQMLEVNPALDQKSKGLESGDLLRRLQAITDTTRIVIRATDEVRMLEEVCRIIVEIGGYRLAWVGYAEEDKEKNVRPVAHKGFEDGYLDTVNISWADTERGRGPTGTAIRTGKTVIAQNILDQKNYAPWRNQALQRGYAASIAVPFTFAGTCRGALNVYAAEPQAFDADEAKLMEELAQDLAFGISTLRERTESQRMAETLRESEEKYRSIFENAVEGFFQTTPAGLYLSANPALAQILGYESPEELMASITDIGKQLYVNHEAREEYLRLINEKGKVKGFEAQMYRKDGSICWVSINTRCVRNDIGEPAYYEGFVLDITCRKQADDNLRKEESLRNILIDNLPCIALILKKGSREIVASNKAARAVGAVPGKTCYETCANRDDMCPFCLAPELWKTNESHSIEVEYRGTYYLGIWVPLSDDLYVHYIFDITERKQAEEALRGAHWRLDSIIESTHAGTWEWNVQTGETIFNETWAQIVGYTLAELAPISIKTWESLAHPDDLKQSGLLLERHFVGELPYYDCECRIKHKDGHWVWVHDRGSVITRTADGKPLLMFGTHSDINSQKQVEAQKVEIEAQNRQLQKAESLGRMAGAIAHTFNNQLGAVIGNLEMAIDDLPKGSGPAHSLLTAAMRAANKAAEVSGQMLTYLGQSFDKHELMDLAEVCRRSLPILEASMPGSMGLKSDLPSPGPAVMANTTEIRQVLTNLITNAWEAAGNGRGSIHLSVKTVAPADIPTRHCYPIDWRPQNNAYACLDVTDTNGGIADEDIENLFDPFFSSKCTGRGMGLAVVLGIVKAHGGAIMVESELGRGSTFRVFLPVSAAEVPRQPDKELGGHLAARCPPNSLGSGTVLLVDDEDMLRDMAAAMLTRLGFTVLAAKDGVEAVELFRQHKDEIRLVLSDLTMPRLDGWETLTALRKLAPDLPVILASGYDKAQVMAGDHPELPQVFLGKPYRLQELRDAIGQALVNRK